LLVISVYGYDVDIMNLICKKRMQIVAAEGLTRRNSVLTVIIRKQGFAKLNELILQSNEIEKLFALGRTCFNL
jgi:hypothetical protein